MNSRGFRMKPTPQDVLAALRATAVSVVATEVTAAQTCPLAEAVAWARAQGAASVVVAIADLAAQQAGSTLPYSHPE